MSSKFYTLVCENCGKEFYRKRLVPTEEVLCETCRDARKAKKYRESHQQYYKDYSKAYRESHKDYFKQYHKDYRKAQEGI